MFPGSFVGIRVPDSATGQVGYPYTFYERRIELGSEPLGDTGFGPHVIRTGRTHVVNERMKEAIEAFGSKLLGPVAELPRSQLMVPLRVGSEVRGLIQLSNVFREHAYGEGEVRLLETLAASMSAALENARLFDETQRLLKETEARNAELAAVSYTHLDVYKRQARPSRAARRAEAGKPRCRPSSSSPWVAHWRAESIQTQPAPIAENAPWRSSGPARPRRRPA